MGCPGSRRPPADRALSRLVDCYRLRLYDRFTICGYEAGLYAVEPTRWGICEDFLVFARLLNSSRKGQMRDWDALLAAAALSLSLPLDDTGALSVYGKAGVLDLRLEAALIYGHGVEEPASQAYNMICDAVHLGFHVSSSQWLADAMMFEDVGGAPGWHQLLNSLPAITSPSSDDKRDSAGYNNTSATRDSSSLASPDIQSSLVAELHRSKRKKDPDSWARLQLATSDGLRDS
jgi:hypothetical protein